MKKFALKLALVGALFAGSVAHAQPGQPVGQGFQPGYGGGGGGAGGVLGSGELLGLGLMGLLAIGIAAEHSQAEQTSYASAP